ncbi:hypothetical protein [Sporolactobacillus putidus]|uniref:hypothetical protein n=1 Tax=Sporolactobacillus putidus TaxID=492735 RepID=UPI0016631086|nr:hypothetical protein [Sporolactobacillus putidus]
MEAPVLIGNLSESSLTGIYRLFPGVYRSSVTTYRSFIGVYRSSGTINRSFIGVYRSPVTTYRSFPGVYRSSGTINRLFPGVYRSSVTTYRSFIGVYRSSGTINRSFIGVYRSLQIPAASLSVITGSIRGSADFFVRYRIYRTPPEFIRLHQDIDLHSAYPFPAIARISGSPLLSNKIFVLECFYVESSS